MSAGRVADLGLTLRGPVDADCTELGHRQRAARPSYILLMTCVYTHTRRTEDFYTTSSVLSGSL